MESLALAICSIMSAANNYNFTSSLPMLLMVFSCLVMSDSLRPNGLQYARFPCSSPAPRSCSNSYPWSWWCHPTILSFVVPFFFCLQSFPASGLFFFFFPFHQVDKVLELQHQSSQWIFRTDFLLDWLVGSPCSPRDSKESSTSQFKSMNSSVLSFLYSPTLTSIQDNWKNHSSD